MKKLSKMFIVIMLLMLASGCGGNRDTGDDNATGDKQKAERRIIAIAPADFEIIYELGAEEQLVGRSEYCDYPEKGLQIESVGECLLPDIEKIIALRPDIVITEYALTNQDVLEALKNAGIEVIVSDAPQDVEGIYDKIRAIAAVTGKEERAEELISQMKVEMEWRKIEMLLSSKQPVTSSGIYYVVDTGEYGEFTATGDTFISEIINASGNYNVAENATGWIYTAEQLILDDPDYIIGMQEHIAKIKNNPQYAGLKAVRNGNVIAVDINILSRPTARSVLEGIPMLRSITDLED